MEEDKANSTILVDSSIMEKVMGADEGEGVASPMKSKTVGEVHDSLDVRAPESKGDVERAGKLRCNSV